MSLGARGCSRGDGNARGARACAKCRAKAACPRADRSLAGEFYCLTAPTTSGSFSRFIGRYGRQSSGSRWQCRRTSWRLQPTPPTRTSAPAVDQRTSDRSIWPRCSIPDSCHRHRAPAGARLWNPPWASRDTRHPRTTRERRLRRRAEMSSSGTLSMTNSRPTALRLAMSWSASLSATAPGVALIAKCSGGTDLPSSNFFAASGSPAGFKPRHPVRRHPGMSDGISNRRAVRSPPSTVWMPCRSMASAMACRTSGSLIFCVFIVM